MTEQLAVELGKNALATAVMLSAPPLLAALVVGLLISVFQAVTQINEITLSFVPKVLVVFVVFLLFGPWMIGAILSFTIGLFDMLPSMVR